MCDYLMVASIDFGTAYSGYAFSLTTDFKRDPLIIYSNQTWNAGNAQLMSLKTPTCILLDKNRNVKSFGFEAESDYSQLEEEDNENQEDYYFFHRFKMILYDNENLEQQRLKDVTGKTLAALEVFSKFIKALKDHLLTQIIEKGKTIEPHEIRWVLTVPTIWTDASKQFMRECAHQAGIDDEKLVIALEPEAASIFCQYQEDKRASNERSLLNRTGQKYMIIDLGGGTADITIHETLTKSDDKFPLLKELHHAIGDDCGGTQVDNAFMEVLGEILGQKLIKLMKKKQPSAYLELLREFETVKRREIANKNNLRIPLVTINELIEELEEDNIDDKIKVSKYKTKIKRNRETFCIDAELMKSFFGPTIDRIVSLVKDTSKIKAIRDVSLFLLVGGFSECKYVVHALKEALPNKTFIVPEEAGLSVLKGAVIFGHKTSIIGSRFMIYSYGTKVFEPFDPELHEISRKKKAGGRYICTKIFDFIVRKNESVPVGTTIKREYVTDDLQQNFMDLDLYKSDSGLTKYIDEEGCYRVCKATIDIPDPSDEQRTVEVEYYFGDTEIRMTAVERDSGKSCKTFWKFI
ncbi:heat shock 70 kDa protein 12B-like isoform X4 [Mytilus californianus]|uniref:heat shock 70 kDa protein 12B-like isoform X4 n=1 Tax=Mytilus californianus TaxID=6549 RepID=UPI0022484370|nr:heat shock 70 kDa protein 12B-like isoform X4 [Mytilus californianus]